MPKDTSKDAGTANDSEMLSSVVATAGTTGIRKSSRTGGGTLTAMWSKKTQVKSVTRGSTSAVVAVSETEEPVNADAGPSSAISKPKETGSKTAKAVVQAFLDTLEQDTMDLSWREALSPEFKKPYFIQLKQFLLNEFSSHTIYPSINNIYSWSRYTPLDHVKVVILGQDPYHDVGQAHGLSFSVLPPTKPPGSLKNIYKQLAIDCPGFVAPNTGDLTPIAEQGVLWLNTSLTVQAHKAGSHSKKGWETFTAQAIRAVLTRKCLDRPGVVCMAWGLPAQKTFAAIGIDEKKHLLLTSPHPSPLSAHRGFIGNGHFKKANEWLAEQYGPDAQINWKILCTKK